ncbi:MAG: class I SAM-dependent methyltransferase [Dehalococcoidia bacterium]|nr:class I SAM-dependent methyltransferase [Dehalococcoidia bacterium]
MKRLKIEGIPGPGAKVYSTIVAGSPIMQDFYREVTGEIASKLSSGRILDIGTGPGYIPIEVARASKNVEVKAIDISSAMVKIACQKAEDAGLSQRVQFECGSAEHIPYGDGYFDLVVSTLSFHHWANRIECLKEIHRVLKTGGEAWIYELRKDTTSKAKKQLKDRYGRFVSFVVLYSVRLHSAMSLQEFQKIISLPQLGFSEMTIEDRGLALKLRLVK